MVAFGLVHLRELDPDQRIVGLDPQRAFERADCVRAWLTSALDAAPRRNCFGGGCTGGGTGSGAGSASGSWESRSPVSLSGCPGVS
jgi:hypothetical protein